MEILAIVPILCAAEIKIVLALVELFDYSYYMDATHRAKRQNANGENAMFQVNQIVKGKRAGTFVILAIRTVGGEQGAQVKPVNPANHAEHGRGEMFLPFDSLVTP